MFKEVISDLTSSVVGAAKETARSYAPTIENINGSFDRIANQGISNLAYRSPILADMAHTMLKNFQLQSVRKDQLKSYINSKSSDDLRKDVTAKLGNASNKKIDSEMLRILSKISQIVDDQGKVEAKNTDIFKEYGKHFEKYKADSTSSQPDNSPNQQPDSGSGDYSQVLAKIDHNTQRTVNALEEMASKYVNVGSGVGGKSGNNTFIDPMTGMPSVSAAIGSIGGSFLSKVFDDDTIEKFSNKAKKLFGDQNTPESPTTSAQPASATPSTENTSESAKEIAATSNKHANDLLDVNNQILDELKKANKNTPINNDGKSSVDVADKKHSLMDKAKDIVKDRVSARFPKLNNVKGNAAKFVAKGADKAIDIGTKAASVIPKVVKGGSALMSGIGGAVARVGGSVLGGAASAIGSGALAAGALAAGAVAAAPWIAGAAAVGYGGYKLYEHFANKNVEAKARENPLEATKQSAAPQTNIQNAANTGTLNIPNNISASKSNVASQITALNQSKQVTEQSKQSQAPIVINNNNNSGKSKSEVVSSVITSSPVRNSESTFERVQMQDFWPRMV